MFCCGGKQSKREKQEDDLKAALASTRFSLKEITELRQRFLNMSENTGRLRKEQFREHMGVLGMDTVFFFSDRIFTMLDSDSDGEITFKDFIKYFDIITNGSQEEKAKMAFNYIDTKTIGVFEITDLQAMISGIVNSWSAVTGAQLNEELLRRVDYYIKHTFGLMNLRNTGRVNFADYSEAIRRNPNILDIFEFLNKGITETIKDKDEDFNKSKDIEAARVLAQVEVQLDRVLGVLSGEKEEESNSSPMNNFKGISFKRASISLNNTKMNSEQDLASEIPTKLFPILNSVPLIIPEDVSQTNIKLAEVVENVILETEKPESSHNNMIQNANNNTNNNNQTIANSSPNIKSTPLSSNNQIFNYTNFKYPSFGVDSSLLLKLNGGNSGQNTITPLIKARQLQNSNAIPEEDDKMDFSIVPKRKPSIEQKGNFYADEQFLSDDKSSVNARANNKSPLGSANKKQNLMESGFESESFGKLSFMKDETKNKDTVQESGIIGEKTKEIKERKDTTLSNSMSQNQTKNTGEIKRLNINLSSPSKNAMSLRELRTPPLIRDITEASTSLKEDNQSQGKKSQLDKEEEEDDEDDQEGSYCQEQDESQYQSGQKQYNTLQELQQGCKNNIDSIEKSTKRADIKTSTISGQIKSPFASFRSGNTNNNQSILNPESNRSTSTYGTKLDFKASFDKIHSNLGEYSSNQDLIEFFSDSDNSSYNKEDENEDMTDEENNAVSVSASSSSEKDYDLHHEKGQLKNNKAKQKIFSNLSGLHSAKNRTKSNKSIKDIKECYSKSNSPTKIKETAFENSHQIFKQISEDLRLLEVLNERMVMSSGAVLQEESKSYSYRKRNKNCRINQGNQAGCQTRGRDKQMKQEDFSRGGVESTSKRKKSKSSVSQFSRYKKQKEKMLSDGSSGSDDYNCESPRNSSNRKKNSNNKAGFTRFDDQCSGIGDSFLNTQRNEIINHKGLVLQHSEQNIAKQVTNNRLSISISNNFYINHQPSGSNNTQNTLATPQSSVTELIRNKSKHPSEATTAATVATPSSSITPSFTHGTPTAALISSLQLQQQLNLNSQQSSKMQMNNTLNSFEEKIPKLSVFRQASQQTQDLSNLPLISLKKISNEINNNNNNNNHSNLSEKNIDPNSQQQLDHSPRDNDLGNVNGSANNNNNLSNEGCPAPTEMQNNGFALSRSNTVISSNSQVVSKSGFFKEHYQQSVNSQNNINQQYQPGGSSSSHQHLPSISLKVGAPSPSDNKHYSFQKTIKGLTVEQLRERLFDSYQKIFEIRDSLRILRKDLDENPNTNNNKDQNEFKENSFMNDVNSNYNINNPAIQGGFGLNANINLPHSFSQLNYSRKNSRSRLVGSANGRALLIQAGNNHSNNTVSLGPLSAVHPVHQDLEFRNMRASTAINVPKRTLQKNLITKKNKMVLFGHQHWNLVLNMMMGIQMAVRSVGGMGTDYEKLWPKDFKVKYLFELLPRRRVGEQSTFKICQFTDYAPAVFRQIRMKFKISSEEYLKSIGPDAMFSSLMRGDLATMSELTSAGKSGSFFYYTVDGKFTLKTIHKSEFNFIKSILPHYHEYLTSRPNTLIIRYYGLHKIKYRMRHAMTYKTIYFIIMSNVFHTRKEIHERFDLKGSLYKRTTKDTDPSVAKKDLDFLNQKLKISVRPEQYSAFMDVVRSDCKFFADNQIIDYSMLLGLNYARRDKRNSIDTEIAPQVDCPDEEEGFNCIRSRNPDVSYYFGIIDILTCFNPKKKLEYLIKRIALGPDVSTVPPSQYAARFVSFMENCFDETSKANIIPRPLISLPSCQNLHFNNNNNNNNNNTMNNNGFGNNLSLNNLFPLSPNPNQGGQNNQIHPPITPHSTILHEA